jgi:hypothetical protein
MEWMTKRKSKPNLSRFEALGCVPVKTRHLREERLASGDVMILYPVTVRPWMAKIARWLGAAHAPPHTGKLQLDLLGSTVWAMLDGHSSIRKIAAMLAEEHRLEPREAEVAVTQFVRELGRRGLIGLR